MLLGLLIQGDLAADDLGNTSAGCFHPADRWIDLTLSVQPHAGRAAGMGRAHPSPPLCPRCRTGMRGWKEWASRRWPLALLPGCCTACKDGFVLKNNPPTYIWGGQGGKRVCSACMGCWHLSCTACPLQRSKSLCLSAIVSGTSPPCVKRTCHPWMSTGAKQQAVIPAWPASGQAAARQVVLVRLQGDERVWLWGSRGRVPFRPFSMQ